MGSLCKKWTCIADPGNARRYFGTMFYTCAPRALFNIYEWLILLASIPNPSFSIIGICTWCLWDRRTCGNRGRSQVGFLQLLWWLLIGLWIGFHPNWMTILCLCSSKLMECVIREIWRHLVLHTVSITWPQCIDKAFLARSWDIHHWAWAWIVYPTCTKWGIALWWCA